MVRLLSDDDVAALLDLNALLPVVEDAFAKQGRGAVERPPRPHFSVGEGLDPERSDEPLGIGLAMPAYIHGAGHFITKVASVHEGNAARGLPTVNAEIVLADAATGVPTAFVDGTRITNARTGCIGGLAARDLAAAPVTIGVLGAGTQARWQLRAIAAATTVDAVRVYSPSDSKRTFAADLGRELDVDVTPVSSPRAAVEAATVVVTATTSAEPVFPGDALAPGALVVAIGAYSAATQELDATTMARAGRVFADVPEEVADIGDVRNTGFDPSNIRSFSDVVLGAANREDADEIIVVESVGSATLDAAAAEHVFERAEANGVGVEVAL